MDEDLHNIEDLFYTALNDNEERPASNVWHRLDRQLDKDKIISIKKQNNQLKKIAVILLAFLIIAMFIIYSLSNNNYLRKSENGPIAINEKTRLAPLGNVVAKNGDNGQKGSFRVGETVKSRQNKKIAKNLISNKQYFNSNFTGQNNLDVKNNGSTSSHVTISLEVTALSFKESSRSLQIGDPQSSDQVSNNYTPKNFGDFHSVADIENLSLETKMSSVKNAIVINHLSKPQMVFLIKKNNDKNAKPQLASKNAKTVSSRFSVTAYFSPDVAWYRLENENTNNQLGNAEEIERDEKHGFSSDYGLRLSYQLNKKWSFETGLSIENTNINSEPEVIYASPDNAGNIKYEVNTSSGYGYILPSFSSSPAIGDSLSVVTLTHSLHYLSVPFTVSYNVQKAKFLVSLKTGLSVNFLTGSKLKTSVENGTNESVETVNNILGVKKMYLNGLAGISAAYQLSERLSLVLGPTIHFALNSINRNTAVKSFPMFFGPSIGLKIKL